MEAKSFKVCARNVNIKVHVVTSQMGNEEHIIGNWRKKAVLVRGWHRTWLNCVLVFCKKVKLVSHKIGY